jgi:hypothetical protein
MVKGENDVTITKRKPMLRSNNLFTMKKPRMINSVLKITPGSLPENSLTPKTLKKPAMM